MFAVTPKFTSYITKVYFDTCLTFLSCTHVCTHMYMSRVPYAFIIHHYKTPLEMQYVSKFTFSSDMSLYF